MINCHFYEAKLQKIKLSTAAKVKLNACMLLILYKTQYLKYLANSYIHTVAIISYSSHFAAIYMYVVVKCI